MISLKILLLHMFSAYDYFKVVSKTSLPSPNGKLSCSCTISYNYTSIANCCKSRVLSVPEHHIRSSLRRQIPSKALIVTLSLYMLKYKCITLSCMDQCKCCIVWPSGHLVFIYAASNNQC